MAKHKQNLKVLSLFQRKGTIVTILCTKSYNRTCNRQMYVLLTTNSVSHCCIAIPVMSERFNLRGNVSLSPPTTMRHMVQSLLLLILSECESMGKSGVTRTLQ